MKDPIEIPRLSRLTAILTMLQSKKILTATEISNKFQISRRTAYRDIKALESSGIPIYTVEGKGYSLVDGYNLPPVMFTEEEANALITAHHIILQNRDKSLIKNHSSAIEKLKTTLKSSGKEKVELLSQRVAYMKNFKRENSSDSLSVIQKAITDFKLISIEYVNVGGVSSSREIEPQALYHTQENWILIAWCRKRNAFREFRLDRIQNLIILHQEFEGRSFHLLEYFAELIELAKKHS